MKTFRYLTAARSGSQVSRPEAPRVDSRRALMCEALEGRQLLNAAWGVGGPGLMGPLVWAGGAPPGIGGSTSADVQYLGKAGAAGGHRIVRLDALKHGAGGKSFTSPKLSARAKADMQTLQTDEKALQAEVPADLTTKIQADQAVIQKAFDAKAPTGHKSNRVVIAKSFKAGSDPTLMPPTPGDPTANLAAALEKADVPAAQADAIVADFATLKTTLASLDPTLQAKITADQAALAKDLPAGPHGVMFAGMSTATKSLA
jgi:hypothetical protein